MVLESLFGTASLFTARQGWTDLMKCASGIRQSRVHPVPLLRASVILTSDMFSLWPRLPSEKTGTIFPSSDALSFMFSLKLFRQWSTSYLVFAVLPSLKSPVSLQLSRHDHSANIKQH